MLATQRPGPTFACPPAPHTSARVLAAPPVAPPPSRLTIAPHVHTQAPGSLVKAAVTGSSNAETGFKSGTSMAAPHVSGVAAQVLGGDLTLSVAQVKQVMIAAAEEDYIRLTKNAIDAGTPNRFLIGGAGIVSFLNRPTPPPSPPLPAAAAAVAGAIPSAAVSAVPSAVATPLTGIAAAAALAAIQQVRYGPSSRGPAGVAPWPSRPTTAPR